MLTKLLRHGYHSLKCLKTVILYFLRRYDFHFHMSFTDFHFSLELHIVGAGGELLALDSGHQ